MIDYSTINRDVLAELLQYTCPPTYHVSEYMGAHCFTDPPGYPTYFLRAIWTKHGNYPARGPYEVVEVEGKFYATGYNGQSTVSYNILLHRLWKPLPLEHPRVIAWQQYMYAYHGGFNAIERIMYFYPDAKPDVSLLGQPWGKGGVGDWWETDAKKPTPETCRPRERRPHPTSGTWCQWCGWVQPEEEAT